MRIDVVHANRPARGSLGAEREAAMRGVASPGTEIVIRLPDSGPRSIASAYEDALAVPQILSAVGAAEAEGADAVLINCTADTGVAAAREAAIIPVVGVCEASFHLAAQLAGRFSVLTFADRIAPRFRAMASAWGMTDRLASVRSIERPLEAICDFDDLAADLTAAAHTCVIDDGAEAIILGCTDFELAATAVAARLDRAGIDVPLIRPYEVGLHLAESLVSMRLRHSKLTYPTPAILNKLSER